MGERLKNKVEQAEAEAAAYRELRGEHTDAAAERELPEEDLDVAAELAELKHSMK